MRIQAPICRDIIGVRIGEAGEGGLNRPELSISCFDLADTRASGVLAESSVRRLSFRAVRAGKRIDRFIGWEPFHREAFGAWKAPTTFMPCIGIPNLESALLLLVILLLLSAVRLRVGLRVRNLQPSRRQALSLPPGSWRREFLILKSAELASMGTLRLPHKLDRPSDSCLGPKAPRAAIPRGSTIPALFPVGKLRSAELLEMRFIVTIPLDRDFLPRGRVFVQLANHIKPAF